MKKRIIWFMLTAVLCTALCIGCGKDEAGESGSGSADRTESTQSDDEDSGSETADGEDTASVVDENVPDNEWCMDRFAVEVMQPTGAAITLPECFAGGESYNYSPEEMEAAGTSPYWTSINDGASSEDRRNVTSMSEILDPSILLEGTEGAGYYKAAIINFGSEEDKTVYYIMSYNEDVASITSCYDDGWWCHTLDISALGVADIDNTTYVSGAKGEWYRDKAALRQILNAYGQPTEIVNIYEKPNLNMVCNLLAYKLEDGGYLCISVFESLLEGSNPLSICGVAYMTDEAFAAEKAYFAVSNDTLYWE